MQRRPLLKILAAATAFAAAGLTLPALAQGTYPT
ncbi:MAG TPA: ABC transporter substrate-binding protein, partial [Cupriavidus sp.]|nr:ABC transporter substrate-binding protein [Cupriavidus sp.]